MRLAPGAKSANPQPLPPACRPDRWVELVTGKRLYPWQRKVLLDLSKNRRPRVAYVQVPRKNGKTFLAVALAIVEVCLHRQRHVYAVSDSERNLNSTFMRELRDIIGGSEYLRDSLHIYHSHIEVPETGSFIETRASNFKASQGINPHLVIFDEVHLQQTDRIWSGMQMAGAARDDALLFGITTPGYDLTSLAHSLYEAVKSDDPTIYGRVFEAPAGTGLDDRRAWKVANPCYSRPRFVEALAFDRGRLPEHEFRRFRLGQWTASSEAWLPYGAWGECADGDRVVPAGTRVWLGFDGSISNDSTALVGVTEDRHVFVVDCWENPGRSDWQVPRVEVEEAVEAAFGFYDVAALWGDPPYWRREMQEWGTRWPGRVVEFNTGSRQRMAPACASFYAAVTGKQLSHDGDPRLARHVSNAVVKQSPQGLVIVKADEKSPAKIDLAVAAVAAFAGASQARPPVTEPKVMVW